MNLQKNEENGASLMLAPQNKNYVKCTGKKLFF